MGFDACPRGPVVLSAHAPESESQCHTTELNGGAESGQPGSCALPLRMSWTGRVGQENLLSTIDEDASRDWFEHVDQEAIDFGIRLHAILHRCIEGDTFNM